MELLNLPLELFQYIVHDLVEYFGPVQAVKLRLVCSKLICVREGSHCTNLNLQKRSPMSSKQIC